MPTLTQEIQDFVNKQRMGFVATIGPANKPNLSPKGTTIALDDNHLAFTGIRSDQTISNLKVNPNLEINVVDPIRRRGYRSREQLKFFLMVKSLKRFCPITEPLA